MFFLDKHVNRDTVSLGDITRGKCELVGVTPTTPIGAVSSLADGGHE